MKSRDIATAAASILFFTSVHALAEGKACDLTNPAELEAVMGGKPTLKASTLPNGADVCTGKAGGSTVTIRLFDKVTDVEKEKEQEQLDKLKKMGATIETRRFSGTNCMLIGPGGKAANHAYVTSCTVSKAQKSATVEISNPSLELRMDKLAPVADQIASRFWQL